MGNKTAKSYANRHRQISIRRVPRVIAAGIYSAIANTLLEIIEINFTNSEALRHYLLSKPEA